MSQVVGQVAFTKNKHDVLKKDKRGAPRVRRLPVDRVTVRDWPEGFLARLQEGQRRDTAKPRAWGKGGYLDEVSSGLVKATLVGRFCDRLSFGILFNQSISGVVWPASLQQLSFGYCVNQPIAGVVWPSTLQELSFGYSFNQPSPELCGRPT